MGRIGRALDLTADHVGDAYLLALALLAVAGIVLGLLAAAGIL